MMKRTISEIHEGCRWWEMVWAGGGLAPSRQQLTAGRPWLGRRVSSVLSVAPSSGHFHREPATHGFGSYSRERHAVKLSLRLAGGSPQPADTMEMSDAGGISKTDTAVRE